MQPVDYTTLMAACHSLRANWLPSRLEKVYQLDRHTLALGLRTLAHRGWLTVSWHPQAARICLGAPPPRLPDTFTFSEQLRHQIGGCALIGLKAIAPWERVIDLQFASRPGESPRNHLYAEIIGKYSNVILTDSQDQIITVAHQVTANQSSVRTVETGQPYELPPPLTGTKPREDEPLASWQERVSLIPGRIDTQLLKAYRGLSPSLVREMLEVANLQPGQLTDSLTAQDWQNLYQLWQQWLEAIALWQEGGARRPQQGKFRAGRTQSGGYTVLGWDMREESEDVHSLLDNYYRSQCQRQTFQQLRHQLQQKSKIILKKLRDKQAKYQQRLQAAGGAEGYRQKADLLMANLHQWQPGMNSITLVDFATGEPVEIPLEPDKNAVHNAQKMYRQHQKLKRARAAVEPLLREVKAEIDYLAQVETNLEQIDGYTSQQDLQALMEVKGELIAQKYLEDSQYRQSGPPPSESQPHHYQSPSGFNVLVGRNNRQNDLLTFRTANDYDLWFHAQEIPGSHILLRLEPGAVAEEVDLQFTANLAAYYSQARESERVPVVYTESKNVYKPKGAKPGIAVYKKERVLWGNPLQGRVYAKAAEGP